MKTALLMILLLGSILTYCQDFKNGTRYLSAQPNSEEYRYFELELTGQSADTVYLRYHLIGLGDYKNYINIGNKLYLEDSLLFFDFGSQTGDTILYSNEGIETKITVDSIKDLKLENEQIYAHFFAHHVSDSTEYTIIKGIGEKKTGLGLFHVNSQLDDRNIISVCRNDSLLYWDTHDEVYMHKGEILDTTCDYYGLAVGGSVEQLHPFHITVYPNPTYDIIQIKNVQDADVRIFDFLGAEVYSGFYKTDLNVSNLPHGAYLMEILKDDIIYKTRFIKE